MSDHLVPTSQHTIGPFFPRTFFQDGDNDLTRIAADATPTARGETIVLRGRVTREGNFPCLNAILEVWQADAGGYFRHGQDPDSHLADPGFLGWGRAFTDAEGIFEFRTLLPGAYEEASGRRAPHINISVMGAGLMRRVQTVIYFPDFSDDNARDAVLMLVPKPRRHLLVATPGDNHGDLRSFCFNIHLRGGSDQETPFFED